MLVAGNATVVLPKTTERDFGSSSIQRIKMNVSQIMTTQMDLLEDQVEELVRSEMRLMISMLSKDAKNGLKNFSHDHEADGILTEEYIKAAQLVLEYYGG